MAVRLALLKILQKEYGEKGRGTDK